MGENFEGIINYNFTNKSFLTEALTHSSYFHENKGTPSFNERIEFLGDVVLGLVISEYLYKRYVSFDEGELSKMRANLVCEANLAKVANSIDLGKFLLLGKGEELTGGRTRDSILADALEAVIGAIYLDGGIDKAERFVKTFITYSIDDNDVINDHKSFLQETIQKYSSDPINYNILSEEGPDHLKVFIASVTHDGVVMGKGSGRTKKDAEQNAAYNAIKSIKNDKKF